MKVVFAGTPEFAARHLEVLIASEHEVIKVITQPDKTGKRGKTLVPSPVKLMAAANALELLQPNKLSIQDLSGTDFDMLVVVAYGQILRSDLLEHPKFGCVNVHASILPRWRGAAPIQRAILAGDTQTGITIIQINAGLDTGDILATHAIDVGEFETTTTLSAKLALVGPSVLITTLNAIETGKISPVPQLEQGSTYAKKIDKEEAQLDWTQDARFVDRQVRAFNPDPITYSSLGELRVKIHQGKPIDKTQLATQQATTGLIEPGKILSVTNQGVTVACGQGAYLIERLQVPLGKGAILSGTEVKNSRSNIFYENAIFEAGSTSP